PVTLPLPAAGVNVIATSATGFPFASFTITDRGVLTAVLAVADWLVALFAAIAAAVPAVPVAVNVTGLPVSDPDVAVRVLLPAVALSVQLPTVAMPLPFVVWLPPVIVPFPGATANVTATPVTGFPFASFTITDGGDATAVPAVADWLVGLFAAIVAAAPAVPVAVKVTGLPESVPDVAVSVLLPAVVPSVQLPTVAIPLASLIWVAPVTLPLPGPGAKVTDTPETGLPNASVTITDGGTGRVLPAGACCPLPPLGPIVAAAAGFTLTAADSVTGTEPFTMAVTVFVPAAVELKAPVIWPLVLVVPAGCVSVMPVTGFAASVTVAPLTGLPFASFTVTVIVLALDPELAMIVAGAAATVDCVALGPPAVAVAVNVTGLLLSPAAVARSVSSLAAVPSVQEFAAATPFALVVTAVAGSTVPLSPLVANVTATPATGLANWSRTITEGGVATAVPTVAACPLPAFTAICVAGPAPAWAVNVTGLPERPEEVAVRVFPPAVVPSVHDVSAAMPLAFVRTGVGGFTLPLPDAVVNVTATPATAS